MSVPPQMPYGAPPPADGSNPYAGNPYAGQQAPPPGTPPPPGYGYPAPPPPAAGYGYPGAQGPQPGPAYGYAPQGGPVCRFCGGFPAVDTTVRGHQGIIIVMRFLKQPGPFCRTCGTAVVRDMSARTLVQGWWSYLSGIFTVVTLLRNLAAHNKIKDLPPPVPGTHGPQLDPGVPLTKRPHMLMLLLPVLSIGTLIVLTATGAFLGSRHDRDRYDYPPLTLPSPTAVVIPTPTLPPSFSLPPAPAPTVTLPTPTAPATSKVASDIDYAKAGDCLRNENGTSATHDSNPRITMLPCTDTRAQYKVLKKVYATSDGDKACENVTGSDSTYTRESTSSALSFVLCLKKL
ncbi:LppU/SCO3897 family protein [Kitasatospora sp. NPDC001574]